MRLSTPWSRERLTVMAMDTKHTLTTENATMAGV